MEILSLGEKIKRKRKELNMTLKDLAKDRITPGQISLIESGRSNPSMDLLEYLSENLNTTIEYLMESEETQAEKICMYYEQIAEAYIFSDNYLASERYIDEALVYVDKYNLEYRKGRILYLQGEINRLKNKLEEAQTCYLSANIIFVKKKKYTEVVKIFLKLGKISVELKSYYSAISYLKQAESVYSENSIGDDYTLGEIYYNLSNVYYLIEKFEESKKYAYLSKEKFEQINNKEAYAKSLMKLSEEYIKNGDVTNAIKYSSKTLELFYAANKQNDVSTIENSLGELFYNFGDITESSKHLELARRLRSDKKKDKLIDTLINICKNHIKLKNMSESSEILDYLYQIVDNKDIDRIISLNELKYTIHMINEENDSAERILIKSYNIAKENDKLKKAADLSIKISKFYMDNKDQDLATKFLDEGVRILKNLGVIEKR
ncbi:helix-turn-helix domain-containing protein [Clostridium sp. MSJ-8]|uniref:helix-turn-helix domain-containing protein n=1 Tax=Clostridium sp. MSJ-8 TaxID=2841510 RepID=UPI001C0EDB52|nr:helix-turn-helix domain-containing protein [Clostridium sp. MSJ-8]MBU5487348.1 helix-turn-helix domain-containing protein [Clostridium sp. MSJ-8]